MALKRLILTISHITILITTNNKTQYFNEKYNCIIFSEGITSYHWGGGGGDNF